MIKNTLRLAAGALLAFGFATGAYAQYGGSTQPTPAAVPSMSKSFHASLSGAQEVPPVAGSGTASADFKLDAVTKTLTWTVTYSGLSSDAVASHIHGPAAMGANAETTYAGARSCATCHPSEFRRQSSSGHASALYRTQEHPLTGAFRSAYPTWQMP